MFPSRNGSVAWPPFKREGMKAGQKTIVKNYDTPKHASDSGSLGPFMEILWFRHTGNVEMFKVIRWYPPYIAQLDIELRICFTGLLLWRNLILFTCFNHKSRQRRKYKWKSINLINHQRDPLTLDIHYIL
jgi:hypothetical protein